MVPLQCLILFSLSFDFLFLNHLGEGALYIVQRLEEQQENVTLK